ncbi:TPA: flagellar basal body rod protein FlgB [Salmonella enterica]|uniref:Flagellar basal body rod protein FlgB n=1 Tax=Salmonella enterica TaxID=28901 RepID=A0A757C679_SALER|nr:flagellar basal body rod protein FlgB [Salmonella enterica subsp. enterica serovar Richmond]HAG0390748.1 flagellar basal body rod protein FlgB [Salmonella enterica]
MSNKLDNEFQYQQQALALMAKRQKILAANIANADTPGYQARDFDFAKKLNSFNKTEYTNSDVVLRRTSEKHFTSLPNAGIRDAEILYRVPDQPSADGNTVDMDRERANFLDNSLKYQSSLSFITSQIKNIMSVVNQG